MGPALPSEIHDPAFQLLDKGFQPLQFHPLFVFDPIEGLKLLLGKRELHFHID